MQLSDMSKEQLEQGRIFYAALSFDFEILGNTLKRS